MHWMMFAFLSVTAFAVSALYQRLAMKKEDSDPITSSIIFQIFLTAGSASVLVFTGFRLPQTSMLHYFFLSAVLYAYGTYFLFRAAKAVEASELIILTGFGTLATLTMSYVILGERMTMIQWIGALLVLSAVMIVNYKHRNYTFHIGTLYALAGTTLYGAAVVFDGLILRTYDSFSFIPVISLLPGIVLMLTFPKSTARIAQSLRRVDKNLIIYSVLYVLAAELFYVALTSGALVSQLATIMRASIVLTVLLAMVFLKERSHPWKKLAGAILTTIGILMLR